MIENGKILAIQNAGTTDADGTRHWNANVLAASIGCTIGAPTRQQQILLGAIISGAQALVYVLDQKMPAGVGVNQGDLLTTQLKSDPSQVMEVAHVIHQVGRGSIDHQEIFLKSQ